MDENKIIFKQVGPDGDIIKFEFKEILLEGVVAQFGHFLLAIGFSPKGVAEYLDHECFPKEGDTDAVI